MTRSENKSETQKVTLKMSETTADNAVQQIVSQTSPNPRGKSGEFRSSYPTTEHLATYKMIDQKCHEWREKCGLLQSTSWKHSTPSLTNEICDTLKSCGIEHEYIHFLRNCSMTRKPQYWQTKKVTCSIWRKKPSKVIHYQACSSTQFCRKHCKTTFRAGKRKAEWVSASETTIMIASQIWDFCRRCTPICSFKRTASKHGLWLQAQHRKMGLRIHEGKTKILSNQSSNRRKIEIDNINVEMFVRKEKQNIWAKWLFSISKRRQKTGIASKLLWQHSTNIDKSWHRKLTCWDTDFGFSTQWYHPRWITHLELGPIQKSMKEWFNATQRKMLRFIIQTKKKYKKIEKRKDKTNENDDTENLGSTEDQKWGWTRFRHVLW